MPLRKFEFEVEQTLIYHVVVEAENLNDASFEIEACKDDWEWQEGNFQDIMGATTYASFVKEIKPVKTYQFEVVQTIRFHIDVEAEDPEEAKTILEQDIEGHIADVDGDGSDFQICAVAGGEDEASDDE